MTIERAIGLATALMCAWGTVYVASGGEIGIPLRVLFVAYLATAAYRCARAAFTTPRRGGIRGY